jgi:hypothetical protein
MVLKIDELVAGLSPSGSGRRGALTMVSFRRARLVSVVVDERMSYRFDFEEYSWI